MTTNTNIALVTGGSRGLGKSMALKLASKGVDIILSYHRNEEAANEVVQAIESLGQKASALQLDTANTKGFDLFFNKVKEILKTIFNKDRFDFFINNAGVGIYATFAETNEDQFDELMNVHLKGPFFLTQKALTLLNDGGTIINISTGLARSSTAGYSAYAAMKGAIEVLTRYQALELGTRGISVNTVAPGAIATDFGGGVVRDNQQLNKFISETTALGRVGMPDDIGNVVAMLCSKEAKWINAQRIEVSGGRNI